jgi:hypothetical protein
MGGVGMGGGGTHAARQHPHHEWAQMPEIEPLELLGQVALMKRATKRRVASAQDSTRLFRKLRRADLNSNEVRTEAGCPGGRL